MSPQNVWIWRTVELAYGGSEGSTEQTLLSKTECQILHTSSPIVESVIWKKPGSDPLANLREPPERQQLGLTEGTQMQTAASWEPILLSRHCFVKWYYGVLPLACQHPGSPATSRASEVQEPRCHDVCHAGSGSVHWRDSTSTALSPALQSAA